MARDDIPGGGPGYGGVVLISVLISLVVSVLVVIGMDRWGLQALAGDEGPTTVQVPALLGMRPPAADELLEGRGLRLVVRDEEPSTEHEAGDIAEQEPLAGSRVDRGTEVVVVVSSGAPLIDIPQVVGLDVEAARRMMEQAGLTVGRVSETGEGEPGTVTETNPPQGTATTPDTPVNIVAVPGGIEVPDLVGESSRDAREKIEEVGLEVGRIRRRYDERRGPWVVLSQDPESGQRVPPGTEVELTINDGY